MDKNDSKYFVIIYKLEGHETWRVHSGRSIEGFEKQAINNKWPKITERNTIEVDRITGQIKPLS